MRKTNKSYKELEHKHYNFPKLSKLKEVFWGAKKFYAKCLAQKNPSEKLY